MCVIPLKIRVLFVTAFICIFASFCFADSDSNNYDPLRIPAAFDVNITDVNLIDHSRDRKIPIRIYLPQSSEPAPVLLFSHGLGGSREGCSYLGRHWSARGYFCVFVQHIGSDTSVWKDIPPRKRIEAMRKAANRNNFMQRIKDVPAVINYLENVNNSKSHKFADRMNLDKIGMAGHSFGAVTTQALSGQKFIRGLISLADERIKAALILSPSNSQNDNPKHAFSDVEIPWMLMTGTKDTSIIKDITVESRQQVYPALPKGDKYMLVLHNAEHSAFTDRPLPRDTEKRNPNHHKAILALSTAFWDAMLMKDTDAKKWLNGDGPQSVLEEKDVFKKK